MPLILRIDVDKSYGRSNLLQKIASKIAENYWLPAIPYLGYLHDLRKLLLYLDSEAIKAHIYFRKCTLPPKTWFHTQILDGHKLGLHAEDTRNYETYLKELTDVQNYFGLQKISSFTKHGSGNWKSGRNHYPPYECDKYLQWGESSGVPFLFGNSEDINIANTHQGRFPFYPSAFWIDRPYTDYSLSSLRNIADTAKNRNIIVLMHCADFAGEKNVEEGMKQLVSMAKQQNVQWVTL